jgi:uncharacterized protein (DUF305 family)
MSTVRRFTLFSTAGLALMVAIGLLIGYPAGLLTPRSHNSPADNSAEAGFARDMKNHHAQAVEMGMIAHQKATNLAVRTLGADIALTQQAQIGMMDQWLTDWQLNRNSTAAPMSWMPDKPQLDNGLMPGMATQEQMTALQNATGPEVDRLFLQMMIKHHLGGIHMVDGVLKVSHNPDVVALAENMKVGQQGEITAMQQLQQSVK